MIPSVQSSVPTDPILPTQPADAPTSGDFKLALGQASEVQASVSTDAAQAREVNPQKIVTSAGTTENHSKAKEEKQSQNTEDVLATGLISALQMVAVPVARPVVVAPMNDVQATAAPVQDVASSSTAESALPVPTMNEIPIVGDAVTNDRSAATSLPKQAVPVVGKDGQESSKHLKFYEELGIPTSQPGKSVPQNVDTPTTKNGPIDVAEKPADTSGAMKAAIGLMSKLPVEAVAEASSAHQNTPAVAQMNSASIPVQPMVGGNSANKETQGQTQVSLPDHAVATQGLPIQDSAPEVAAQVNPRTLPTAEFAAAKPQASQSEASQAAKAAKPRAVHNDGQSPAVASQAQYGGAQPVAAAQADNKSDSSSTKSFTEDGAKPEGKKTESAFDPQAGVLAEARQTASQAPGNAVRAAAHSPAANATIPAARQFQAMPNISSAQLMQTMNGSEMRVGLHSAEFGNIAIHTAIENGNVSANISVEHSSLGKAVADQLPGLASKLHDEGIRTQINIQDQSAGFSGEARQQQSQEYQQTATPNAVKIPFQVERATNTTSVSTAAAATTNGRLSIRI